MISKKILILATYPIEEPLHGGQKRTKAIFEQYQDIFEAVKFTAVFHKKYFDHYGPDDLPIADAGILARIEENSFLSDILCGEALYDDPGVKQKLAELLKNYQPDIVQIEQIYAYAGLSPLLAELGMKPKLILSSHNLEYRMKKEIYDGLKLDAATKESLLNKIDKLERTASKRARLVIAVSENDASEHCKMGAKRVLVIPNGTQKTIPTKMALEHWRKFKREHGAQKLITFVGSAHPPNLFGFQKMVGEDLDFLPKGAALMLAGGISQYMQETYKAGSPVTDAFWRKAVPLGRLSDDNLAGVIAESEVLLLPIVSGGGSNLKTAEAILSGNKTVATSYAFRSYEKYKHLPNIQIADKQADFQQRIITMLTKPYIKRSPEQTELAEQVQWQYCLKPLIKYMPIYIEGRARLALRRARNSLAYRVNRVLGRG
jgi:hypothetical protein